jgi:carbonic anhydrase
VSAPAPQGEHLWRNLVAAHDARPARDIEPERHQAPHVALLTCSDARIADNGLRGTADNEVFSIRVAGAIPNDEVLASLAFAVVALAVPLVVVMTHQRCGTISGAIAARAGLRTDAADAMLAGVEQYLPPELSEDDAIEHVARSGTTTMRRQLAEVCASTGTVMPTVIAALIDHDTDEILTVE